MLKYFIFGLLLPIIGGAACSCIFVGEASSWTIVDRIFVSLLGVALQAIAFYQFAGSAPREARGMVMSCVIFLAGTGLAILLFHVANLQEAVSHL